MYINCRYQTLTVTFIDVIHWLPSYIMCIPSSRVLLPGKLHRLQWQALPLRILLPGGHPVRHRESLPCWHFQPCPDADQLQCLCELYPWDILSDHRTVQPHQQLQVGDIGEILLGWAFSLKSNYRVYLWFKIVGNLFYNKKLYKIALHAIAFLW